jgi:DsbC/DsbD-like thiol-disulfide interchange protein
MKRNGFLLALASLLALGLPDALAQKSDSKVKIVAAADKPDADGKQTVTLTFEIEKGWHLYANPVGNDDYKDIQTTVKVLTKVEEAKVEYPAGKLVMDKVAGDYKTYEDRVQVKVQVKRTKGDTGPIELAVSLQACNEKTCLQPATVKVTTP